MKKFFKTLSLAVIILTGLGSIGKANNLAISALSVVGVSPGTAFTLNFNVSWDNSWNLATTPINWDAAWIFIKYKDCNPTNFIWNHVTVDAAGHTAAVPLQVDVSTDRRGVFLRRSAFNLLQQSTGSVAVSINVTVPNGSYDFKVFGVEMVWVPTANFFVGDVINSPSPNGFNEITIDNAAEVGGLSEVTLGGGVLNPGPTATYPMGYTGFYCMKYEVSLEQYVDFLNTLIYTQQATRTTVAPSSAPGTGAHWGIAIVTSGINATNPAVYGCNMTADALYNQANDGQNTAMNQLSWADLSAYLWWAALRPMTDLEYEKACRGSDARLAGGGEFAGGSILSTAATGPTNALLVNEVSTASGYGLMNYGNPAFARPLRVGFSATAASTRLASSTSYYGICDLSGNVWERIVSMSVAQGLTFNGSLGDGQLTSPAGEHASPGTWPTTNANGSGFRGGAYNQVVTFCRISDRQWAKTVDATRGLGYGGRGVRQYP